MVRILMMTFLLLLISCRDLLLKEPPCPTAEGLSEFCKSARLSSVSQNVVQFCGITFKSVGGSLLDEGYQSEHLTNADNTCSLVVLSKKGQSTALDLIGVSVEDGPFTMVSCADRSLGYETVDGYWLLDTKAGRFTFANKSIECWRVEM